MGNVTVKPLGPPTGPVTGALTNTKLSKTVDVVGPDVTCEQSCSKWLGVLLVVERSIWTLLKMSVKEGSVTEPSGRKAI